MQTDFIKVLSVSPQTGKENRVFIYVYLEIDAMDEEENPNTTITISFSAVDNLPGGHG